MDKKKLQENEKQFWVSLEDLLKNYTAKDSLVVMKISDTADKSGTNNQVLSTINARHLVVFAKLAQETIDRQIDQISDENPRVAAKIMAQMILMNQADDEENADD